MKIGNQLMPFIIEMQSIGLHILGPHLLVTIPCTYYLRRMGDMDLMLASSLNDVVTPHLIGMLFQ
jgi:hypothetical protein